MTLRRSFIIMLVIVGLLMSVSISISAREHFDLGGRTVRYVGWYNMFAGISEERISSAEEEFNCEITQHHIYPWIEPYGEGIMSRLLTGESAYDIWTVQNMVGFFDVMPQGALYPLGHILPDDYYDDFTTVEIQRIEAFDHRGNRYAFGHTAPYANHVWLVIYNQSMLERIGTADPFELYQQGEWTWEAFTEIARAATADTDGDGQIDRFGFNIHHNGLLTTILAASNNASVTVEENGRRMFTFDQEAALQAINQVNQWVNEDEIMGVDLPDNPLINGYLAMQVIMPYGLAEGDFKTSLEEAADKFVVVPIPRGPQADNYVFSAQAIESRVFPSNISNPEALLALDKYLFRGQEDLPFEEYLAERVTNRETAEVLRDVNDNFAGVTNFLMEGVIGVDLWTALEEVFAGEKSAAAAMNEIKPLVQSKLDDLFLN